MTMVRANIVQGARTVLARSATVAVRYCCIRRQFTDKDAPQTDERRAVESQVINYQTVQHKIFPVLAQAFACHFTVGPILFGRRATKLTYRDRAAR